MRAVILGGTGFIGMPLANTLLEQGGDVVVPSRNPAEGRFLFEEGHSPHVRFVEWDGKTPDVLARHCEGADVVINLAGENIGARRWDDAQKERILTSRIHVGEALVAALQSLDKLPSVCVQASAVGFYGGEEERGPGERFFEEASSGNGFLAETARRWEESTAPLESMGIRRVLLRTGVVLGKGGGVLKKFIPPFQWYLGGPLGSGKQGVAWVHRMDVVHAILHLISCEECRGPYNIVAPSSVTMAEFCHTLGSVLRRPSWLPVPAFALRFALGEMAEELILQGQNVTPARLVASGYRFQFSELEVALRHILQK